MIRFYLSLVAAVYIFIIEANADNIDFRQTADKWLNGQDFKLESTLRVVGRSSREVRIGNRFTEYYSNEQKRAVLEINYQPIDVGAGFVGIRYIFDGNQLIRQSHQNGASECKPAQNNTLAEDILGALGEEAGGRLSESFSLLNGDDMNQVANYLIGPAKLAFWVNKIRSKLIPIQTSDKTRNLNTISYGYHYNFGPPSSSISSDLSIYYANNGLSPGPSSPLPLNISILLTTEDELIFEYSGLRSLDYNAWPVADELSFNPFMIPINQGCSERIKSINLLQGKQRPLVVSFRASTRSTLPHELPPELPQEGSHFVAYDGYASTLRRDSISGVSATTGETQHSVTISDYVGRIKYNIKKVLSYKIEGLIQIQDEEENQCIATSINDAEALLNEQQIIPFNLLVEMGQTTVRGIKSVAFEMVTELLPAMFFPTISFIGLDGSKVAGNNPAGIGVDSSSGAYTIVYYFAISTGDNNGTAAILQANGEPLGPLLRLEVYKEGRLVHKIDIENFFWQLMDAPNGDRASELFSISDKCSSYQLKAESCANLSMELEVLGGTQNKDSNGNQFDGADGPKEVPRMLLPESYANRNTAIRRALTLNTSLAATQIHDLESRVHRVTYDKLLIKVNAKLVRTSRRDTYDIVNIGTTTTLSALKRGTGGYEPMSFADCYWSAMHKQRHNNMFWVIFTFCHPYCVMYDGLTTNNGPNNTVKILSPDMQKFTRGGKDLPCLVFRIAKLKDDPENAVGSQGDWKYLSESLSKGPLLLSSISADGHPDEIKVLSKKVEISNAGWSSVSGTESNSGHLEGLGLVAASGVIQVDPRRQEMSNMLDKLSEEDGQQIGAMSYALCHSSCVSSFDCKSFSVCSRSGQLQCLQSAIDLRDSKLLEQIGKQTSAYKLRNGARRGTITVEVPRGESVSDNDETIRERSAGANRTIELRIDQRCHLYAKRTMELFKPASIARTELKNRNLIASDSEEQCAEICLGRNLLYFRRAAIIKGRYLENENSLELGRGGFMAELRAKEERNLQSWCDSFAYIDSARLKRSELTNLSFKNSAPTKSGLCHINSQLEARTPGGQIGPHRETTGPSPGGQGATVMVDMQKYDFIYGSLYEPCQAGLKLMSKNPAGEFDLNEFTPDEARNFLSTRNNQAFMAMPNPEACARVCFMQTVKLKPWCRSFGFAHHKLYDSRGRQTAENMCIFNSNTMTTMLKNGHNNKTEQVVTQVPSYISFHHYEPKKLLNLDDVVFTQLSLEERLPADANQMNEVRLHSVGVSVLLSLAMISGLTLGVALSVFLTRQTMSSRRNSHLSTLINGINFPMGTPEI